MITAVPAEARRRIIGVGDFQPNRRTYELVTQVLDSGRLSYGPMTERLESMWATIHGVKHAIAVTSGTAALDTIIRTARVLLGWPDGAEIIIPAVTFVATANVCLMNNLVPVPVDVDPRTGNINPFLIADAVTPRTVAIMPVHLFGQPARMLQIDAIARAFLLTVIEDSCETFGVGLSDKRDKMRMVGGWGMAGAFSTYVAHHIPAGIGGIVTTNDDDIYDMARSIVNHGRNLSYWNADMAVSDPSLQFRFGQVGQNYRTHELVSAVAVAEMEDGRWERNLARRREVARLYADAFSRLDHAFDVTVQEESGDGRHSWMMYPVFYKPADERPEFKFQFMDFLRTNGVDTRETLPLISQPVYQRVKTGIDVPAWLKPRIEDWKKLYDEERLPVAARMNRTGFYLPCHHLMTDEEVMWVIKMVRGYVV